MAKVKYDGCTVPSCDRMHRANGFCNLHLSRLKRGKPLEAPLKVNGPKVKTPVCTVENCQNDHYAKSLCRYHYERNRKGIPFDQKYGVRVPAQFPPCPGPECDQLATTAGLCKSHYTQQHKGYELTPVKRIKAHPVTENGRACSKCRVFKPVTEYYIRTTGTVHSICKRCLTAMASIKQWERKGGEYPEWAVDYLAERV